MYLLQILLSLTTQNPVPVDGYREAKWEMAPNDVRSALGSDASCRSNTKHTKDGDVLVCAITLADTSAEATFTFIDGGLHKVDVVAKWNNGDGPKAVRDALVAKFGETNEDRMDLGEGAMVRMSWPAEGVSARIIFRITPPPSGAADIHYEDVAWEAKVAAGQDAQSQEAADKAAQGL